MFVVVAYDISDDRRRTRLHKHLKSFGTPVQYSVFECVLTEQELQRLKQTVRQTIKGDEDLVRYYWLCEGCCRKIEALNGVVTEKPTTVVI
jgi:CRISPR-associated protein Cas2